MKCPHCHFENVSDTRFCGNCAALLHPGPAAPAGPAAATVTARIPCGEILPGRDFAGRYTIYDELGRGGMGRVYKALDKEISETVALKVLVPELALDERMIERFRNELKLARRIAHKNVCRIFDLGNCEGTYFITMEYVAGDDLKSIIRMMGPLGPSRALSVAGQVCDGLAEAHRLGVVHRDLKSANIMIDREGSARIMDFGIARTAESKGLTDRGTLVGTPEYMAPEQVEGLEVDPRADIYSLGVILFEMVTGRLPFEGKTPLSVALMHKTARPPDTRELNAQTPERLSAAIAKCLEKDRGSRYQRIEELAAELHGVAEALGPGRERPASAEGRHPHAGGDAGPPLRRRPALRRPQPPEGPGLFLRGPGRGDHHLPGQDPGARGRGQELGLLARVPQHGCPRGRTPAGRGRGRRRQRPQDREQAPHHGPAPQCR